MKSGENSINIKYIRTKENIVSHGENVDFQHLHLFPQRLLIIVVRFSIVINCWTFDPGTSDSSGSGCIRFLHGSVFG